MNIFAIDTSLLSCSVAIAKNQTILSSFHQDMERGQAEQLIPAMQHCLAESHLVLKEINAIAVTTGPGSFTGIRIGLATAKAFALSLDIPIIAFSTLEATAAAFLEKEKKEKRNIFVLIPSAQDDFFAQIFSSDRTPVSKPELLSLSQIEKHPLKTSSVFISPSQHDFSRLDVCFSPFTAQDMAKHAALTKKLTKNPEPLYIKPPYVSL